MVLLKSLLDPRFILHPTLSPQGEKEHLVVFLKSLL